MAKNHGFTNIAVLEKGWIGGGNTCAITPRAAAKNYGKAPAHHELTRERTELSLWRLYGPAGGFVENIGIDLPGATNHAIQDGDLTALCLAPGEWLLVGERPDLGSQVENAGGALSDLGHARVVFRMPANLGREVLAKDCPLDLRPEIFPPGRSAQSVLAGVAILVHHLPTGDDMDIYVARSYGLFIHDWLLDAASR